MDNKDTKDTMHHIDNKLMEIERLIKEFKEKFEAGTSDTEHFMTKFEI
jgi:archaellum component FlaC